MINFLLPKGSGKVIKLNDNRKGRIFDNLPLVNGKALVYLIDDDDKFIETGEGKLVRLIVSPQNFQFIGFFD